MYEQTEATKLNTIKIQTNTLLILLYIKTLSPRNQIGQYAFDLIGFHFHTEHLFSPLPTDV